MGLSITFPDESAFSMAFTNSKTGKEYKGVTVTNIVDALGAADSLAAAQAAQATAEQLNKELQAKLAQGVLTDEQKAKLANYDQMVTTVLEIQKQFKQIEKQLGK